MHQAKNNPARRRGIGGLRRGRFVLGGVALALAIAACGSSSGGSTAGGTTAPGTTAAGNSLATSMAAIVAQYRGVHAPFVAPGPAVDGTKYKGGSLWYVALSQAIPVLAIEQNGIKQAADALGMSFHVCDGKFQPAVAAGCINSAVSAGATGIFTDSIVTAAVSTAVTNAAQKHIPIIAMSAIGTNTPNIAYFTNGDERSEALAADWIIADSGGKANILTTQVQDDSGAINDINTGSLPEFTKCTGCKRYVATYTSGTVPSVPSLISSSLLKHPDVNYGFPQFDFLVPLFKSGVQTAGYTNKMKIVSTNSALSSMQLVKSGGQTADIGSSRNYAGWAATDAMLRLLTGVSVPTVSSVPQRIFDKTNIDSVSLTAAASVTGEWWGSLDYQTDFPKLWGLS